MDHRMNEESLKILFREARSQSAWLGRSVSDDLLRELYELTKWGPTSVNCCPARILFLRTPEAKRRLLPALSQGNADKTMKAPVTAIVAYDLRFYDHLPKLFPNNPSIREVFARSPEVTETTAFRNGTLQGAYFILAARSLGLDCGPMSGFDNAKVDAEFFPALPGEAESDAEVMPTCVLKSNFLCNLGCGDRSKLHPRNPRLEFEEACRLL
jgi:3-hydroxypropanoate dehydrogenase